MEAVNVMLSPLNRDPSTFLNSVVFFGVQTTGSRYKTSICALPVAPSVSPAASLPSSQDPDAMQ